MTNVVIRDGLACRYEGEVLLILTPGECADEIQRLMLQLAGVAKSCDEYPEACGELKKSTHEPGNLRLRPDTLEPGCKCIVGATFVSAANCPIHGKRRPSMF